MDFQRMRGLKLHFFQKKYLQSFAERPQSFANNVEIGQKIVFF